MLWFTIQTAVRATLKLTEVTSVAPDRHAAIRARSARTRTRARPVVRGELGKIAK